MNGNKTNISPNYSIEFDNTSDNDSDTQTSITQGKHIIFHQFLSQLITNCSCLNFRTPNHGFKEKTKECNGELY